MSWWDKLFNRSSTVETRLEVGDAALIRGENKACALDIFEIEQVTGKKMSVNSMYSKPWRYALTVPEKLNPTDFGIDTKRLSAEKKAKLDQFFDFG